MNISLIYNIILFAIRLATFIICAVLSFNLLSEWRDNYGKETNGLLAARIALIILILSLLLENFIYGVSYLHGQFDSNLINAWLSNYRPIVILTRLGVLYGVYRLYLLFFKKHKE